MQTTNDRPARVQDAAAYIRSRFGPMNDERVRAALQRVQSWSFVLDGAPLYTGDDTALAGGDAELVALAHRQTIEAVLEES